MAKLKPDLIFAEMIRTCTYYDAFMDCKAVKLANLDDLLSTRYERQLSSKYSAASFTGAYGGKLPDCKKFKIHTGWEPEISFDKTMHDLLDYWRAKVAKGEVFLTR